MVPNSFSPDLNPYPNPSSKPYPSINPYPNPKPNPNPHCRYTMDLSMVTVDPEAEAQFKALEDQRIVHLREKRQAEMYLTMNLFFGF